MLLRRSARICVICGFSRAMDAALERFDYPTCMSASADSRIPLLLVVGPTASGKSSLGLEVADAIGGEIISADAFAVYRGLDIGTDKPDMEARRKVRHHLIDVADPTERFSAGRFVEEAVAAMAEVRGRGATPVVVGGTHFWIRALIEGLFPSPARDPRVGDRLAREWEKDPSATFQRLTEVDTVAAEGDYPSA